MAVTYLRHTQRGVLKLDISVIPGGDNALHDLGQGARAQLNAAGGMRGGWHRVEDSDRAAAHAPLDNE